MNEASLQLKALEIQLQRQSLVLDDIKSSLINQSFYQNIPAYCTLEQACNFKGGSTAKNINKRWWQQPCCGKHYQRYNGRRVWSRQQVIRWLQVTDETLEEYAKELGIDISRHFKDGKNI